MRAVIEYGLYDIVPPEDDEVWMYGLEQTITSIDDPRLLLDGRKGDAERDGQETEDESTGEHGVPQSDGDVITCSEDESDGEDRVDYEGGGPHVPSADTLDDHRYRESVLPLIRCR